MGLVIPRRGPVYTSQRLAHPRPGQHRHLHDRVERGQHISFRRARKPEHAAEQQAQQHARAEAHRDPRKARADVHPQFAAADHAGERIEDERGRRQHLRRDPAVSRAERPQRGTHGGQQPGQRDPAGRAARVQQRGARQRARIVHAGIERGIEIACETVRHRRVSGNRNGQRSGV